MAKQFTFDNFSHKIFVEYVMDKMQITDANEEVKEKIQRRILMLLGDRIFLSVMGAMTEENLAEFETAKKVYEDMSEFEILYSMLEKIPMLQEVLLKNVNDLADELLYDFDKIDQLIEKNKTAKIK